MKIRDEVGTNGPERPPRAGRPAGRGDERAERAEPLPRREQPPELLLLDLQAPLLYLSLAFKRRRAEYYRSLSDVRTRGDWEGWTGFFLDCVREAADDGVAAAARLFKLLAADRQALTGHAAATVPAIRLLDLLPRHPMVTLASAVRPLEVSKPTALKAIGALLQAGVLQEVTGRRRDRIYAYQCYLAVLAEDTAPL